VQHQAGGKTAYVRLTSSIPRDAPLQGILEFALTYNGYERLATEVEHLHGVVEPVLTSLAAEEAPPEWAGIDLLRGALFFIQRQTHHWGDVPDEQERFMRQLVGAIAERAAGADIVADEI
jgi:hypothetical protein